MFCLPTRRLWTSAASLLTPILISSLADSDLSLSVFLPHLDSAGIWNSVFPHPNLPRAELLYSSDTDLALDNSQDDQLFSKIGTDQRSIRNVSPMPPSNSPPFEKMWNTNLDQAQASWPYTSSETFNLTTELSNFQNHGLVTPDLTECLTPASTAHHASLADSEDPSHVDFITDDHRWHATESRLRIADRFFLYGVLTTKLYCRPSCPSRRPSRRHVRFFPFPGAIKAAEEMQLRPCKRCKPNDLDLKNSGVIGITKTLREIIQETRDISRDGRRTTLKLDSLAKTAGMSPFHFHRLFKATTRMTPGDFIHACRIFALQDTLRTASGPQFPATQDPSYLIKKSACWGLRTARKALGGISPTEYVEAVPLMTLQYCHVGTPAGTICIVFSPDEVSTNDMSIHAIYPVQCANTTACLHFPSARLSPDHESQLQECISGLEKEAAMTADYFCDVQDSREQ